MKNLKQDTLRFLRKDRGTPRDNDAARVLEACAIDARHVAAGDHPSGEAGVDVMVHATPETVAEARGGDAGGRIENALRETAGPSRVRHLQWVEEPEPSTTARTAAGIGDGERHNDHTSRSDEGMPPPHERESGGHGWSQSPAQPGDTTINPPPNPKR